MYSFLLHELKAGKRGDSSNAVGNSNNNINSNNASNDNTRANKSKITQQEFMVYWGSTANKLFNGVEELQNKEVCSIV